MGQCSGMAPEPCLERGARSGAVPRKNLVGKVFFVYWPLNRISFK